MCVHEARTLNIQPLFVPYIVFFKLAVKAPSPQELPLSTSDLLPSDVEPGPSYKNNGGEFYVRDFFHMKFSCPLSLHMNAVTVNSATIKVTRSIFWLNL